MKNPWENVALSDYENHMALSNVYQLQTLDMIMAAQFAAYDVKSAAVLGVAGGNGLGNLASLPAIGQVYGVDINPAYLRASVERHPELSGRYHTVCADINTDCSALPRVELVIANLFVEYVGNANFAAALRYMRPRYVSCVIQVDPADSFVSDSPYTQKLEVLDSVHSTVDAAALTEALGRNGYIPCHASDHALPNGKILRRLDFMVS